jgi:hypothetical protein
MATGKLSRLVIGALAALAVAGAGPALAQRSGGGGGFHGGGGGGAFHGGGGGFHAGGAFHSSGGALHGGGFHGGGAIHGGAPAFRGAGGFRGGAYGGFHGRGGYGWGGYGAAGWLGYGLFFSALPLAYATYYWDGVPYYYADDNYYQWVDSAGQYETVDPPAGVVNEVAAAAPADAADAADAAQPDLFAYPQNGQSATQQAKDRTDCQQWASGQVGSDAAKHDDYLRAEAACLTGKGYSVR